MTKFKSLTIWTVVLNFFILIGSGHGFVINGYIEILGLPRGYRIGGEDLSLSLTNSYFDSFGAVAVYSLIGQILLLISLTLKNFRLIFWTKIIGLLFLWIGFYVLTHHFFDEVSAELGLYSGIPFLIASILLAYKFSNSSDSNIRRNYFIVIINIRLSSNYNL